MKATRSMAVDATHIPGLTVGDDVVSGPPDAVGVYLRRAGVGVGVPAVEHAPFVGAPPDFRPYQHDALNWIYTHWQHYGAAILADEMGLGKSAVAIAACDVVKAKRILVVCPGSVRLTWEAQIKQWSSEYREPGRDIAVVTTGGQAAWVGTMTPRPRWVVISYELMEELDPTYYPDVIIIDEAHHFSGRLARRSKRLDQLCALTPRRLALTGTPISSRTRDYWQLLKCLFRGTFGSSWDFDHAYCDAKRGEHGGLDNTGASRTEELRYRLSYYQLRRLKSEVAGELPKLSRNIHWIEPTVNATLAFKSAMVHRNKGGMIKALNAALDGKLAATIELAVEARRFLLFTWQREHAYYLHRMLAGPYQTPCVLITGDSSDRMRKAEVERAVRGAQGVVATIDSIGTGFDGLQYVGSVGIFHSLDFVPLKLLQAEKRLDRLGQTLPVQWNYMIMRESMDEWVYNTVVSKLDQWTQLMGKDEAVELRQNLGATEAAEDAALKLIYEEME